MRVLEKASSPKRKQDKEYLTQSNRGKRIIRLLACKGVRGCHQIN